jgi:DNA processing protein
VRENNNYLDKYGVRMIHITDKDYPACLKEIHNPPAILYVKGELKPGDANAVAIVGSRECSEYGETVARKLAGEIADAGITIISGLALGIDAIAHGEAVARGSRTIAVLANGLDMIYPQKNRELAERILQNGAILSEQPIGERPLRQYFPARNRIISGLSKGVLIIEGSDKSGTLHTANFAVEQNREVYAVPGNIDNPLAYLPNDLIKRGAKVVTESSDILEDYAWDSIQ